MKKLAVFVEGQTEQMFIEKFITEIANKNEVQIELQEARGGASIPRKLTTILGSRKFGDEKFYVIIVDCGSDSKVVSDIRDEYESLKKASFSKIIGVRDLYPNPLSDLPKLVSGTNRSLATLSATIDIQLVIAVMEIEAWFLSESTHFIRIDSKLTKPEVKRVLSYDPGVGNLENVGHPSEDLDKVYQTVKKRYQKTKKQVQRTVTALDYELMYMECANRVPSLGKLRDNIDDFLVLPDHSEI
jgi:Domain of unknown function (DUF4276)